MSEKISETALSSPVLEYGYVSLNKKGEELCGDRVEIIRGEDSVTLVLADGMGSGVKANILSTLTSKILCTMIAAGVSLDECIDAIMDSLPVCKQRGVAYSTFSIICVDREGRGYLAEFDNPPAIYLKSGGSLARLARVERDYRGKKLYLSDLSLSAGDELIVFSDGVVHAGVGETLNFGWQQPEIEEFVALQYAPDISARTMASILANACYGLYGHRPGDDTTVLAVKYRDPTTANIMIGPPVNPARDEFVVGEFMKSDGKKIVCGGTSSQVVARVLGKEVSASFDYPDKDVPPIGYIDGIDLTTEGVLTLKKLVEKAEFYLSAVSPEVKVFSGKDGASLLAKMLLIEATRVNIFVGRNVNLAHEGLGIDNKTKLDLVVRLVNTLKQLGKQVEIKYY